MDKTMNDLEQGCKGKGNRNTIIYEQIRNRKRILENINLEE